MWRTITYPLNPSAVAGADREGEPARIDPDHGWWHPQPTAPASA